MGAGDIFIHIRCEGALYGRDSEGKYVRLRRRGVERGMEVVPLIQRRMDRARRDSFVLVTDGLSSTGEGIVVVQYYERDETGWVCVGTTIHDEYPLTIHPRGGE